MSIFEISKSIFQSGTFIAIVLALILFIAVPFLMAKIQYNITKIDYKRGMYLLIALFSSITLFGIYSLILFLINLIVYFRTIKKHGKNTINV